MSIDELEQEIINTVSQYHYIKQVVTILKTSNTIKARLEITSSMYIQIYQNIQKNLVNYVLIMGNQRIYGRDCDGGKWHRHPVENPDSHDFSDEGAREVKLDEFLLEVGDILIQLGIV